MLLILGTVIYFLILFLVVLWEIAHDLGKERCQLINELAKVRSDLAKARTSNPPPIGV
jgi:hypothetical protein